MPDINIYIDAELADEDDWQQLVPTTFQIGSSVFGRTKTPIEFEVGGAVSGTTDMQVEATLSGVFSDVANDIIDEFNIRDDIGDGIKDVDDEVRYQNGINYFNDTNIDSKITGILYPYADNTQVKHVETTNIINFQNNIIDEFKIYFQLWVFFDIPIDVTVNSESTRNNTPVEITLSYYFPYFESDIFSTVKNLYSLDTDVTISGGRVADIYTDLVACSEILCSGIDSDMFSTIPGIKYHIADTTVSGGRIILFESDIFSTATSLSGVIACDVSVFSLYFGDFFLDVEEFTTVSSVAWVDVVDTVNTIDLNQTYFLVNGTQISGIYFTAISNGQRMFYNPPDDFYSRGNLVYTAHVTNSIGAVIEKNYHLLYGYDVEFAEYPVDWGYNKEVTIWAQATNLVFCPNTETDAFYFRTADLHSYNLGATIQAVESVDLNATIYPQNTFFFYERTYTIKISGIQDFAGNKMSDFNFSFTIENK